MRDFILEYTEEGEEDDLSRERGRKLRGERSTIGVHWGWRWQRLVTSRRVCQGRQGLSHSVHRGLR